MACIKKPATFYSCKTRKLDQVFFSASYSFSSSSSFLFVLCFVTEVKCCLKREIFIGYIQMKLFWNTPFLESVAANVLSLVWRRRRRRKIRRKKKKQEDEQSLQVRKKKENRKIKMKIEIWNERCGNIYGRNRIECYA